MHTNNTLFTGIFFLNVSSVVKIIFLAKAKYLTKYVPKEILEQKFMDSIEKAKVQLEQRKNIEDKE